jgi:exopolysaccharide biosynthesis WecB/TagA/CpsF family protein
MDNIILSGKLEAIRLLEDLQKQGKGKKSNTYSTFLNPYSYYLFKDSINSNIKKFDYIFSDGKLLCILYNLFHSKKIKRYSFDLSSLGKNIFEIAHEKKMNLCIIGGTQEDIEKSTANLKIKYTGINIIFSHSGYFNSKEEIGATIDKIAEADPQITLIGTGTPSQDNITLALKARNTGGFTFTCGGFLTQTARKVDYYHPIIKKTGLYWLQRAFDDKHVRRRLLKDYPSFIIKYIVKNLFNSVKV